MTISTVAARAVRSSPSAVLAEGALVVGLQVLAFGDAAYSGSGNNGVPRVALLGTAG